jgi:hypothetical protein
MQKGYTYFIRLTKHFGIGLYRDYLGHISLIRVHGRTNTLPIIGSFNYDY